MRYDPAKSLYPRGYAGATGTLAEVSLVLCIAEPGEPKPGANPQRDLEPSELPADIATRVARAFREGRSPFHKNVVFLLDCCWPNMPFDEQLRRTWITEGVLCSAGKTTGPVPAQVERECASRYLKAQLALLPDAFVIALGAKAKRRLKLAGRPPDACVVAAGRPAGNWATAKPSWRDAGAVFQQCRTEHGI